MGSGNERCIIFRSRSRVDQYKYQIRSQMGHSRHTRLSCCQHHVLREVRLCGVQMVLPFASVHSSPSTKKKFVLNLALRKELNPEVGMKNRIKW